MNSVIGSGSYGKCITGYLPSDIDHTTMVCIKKYNTLYGSSDIVNEVSIMTELSHPNIMKLLLFHDNSLYLPLYHGDLQQLFTDYRRNNQELFRDVAKQIGNVMVYLKCNGVIHRDISPKNIMFKRLSNSKNTYVLGDFGLSCWNPVLPNGNYIRKLSTNVYIESYRAPELVNASVGSTLEYSFETDWWAFGVLLASCRWHYTYKHTHSLMMIWLKQQGFFVDLSSEANQDFILLDSLLQINPKKRRLTELIRYIDTIATEIPAEKERNILCDWMCDVFVHYFVEGNMVFGLLMCIYLCDAILRDKYPVDKIQALGIAVVFIVQSTHFHEACDLKVLVDLCDDVNLEDAKNEVTRILSKYHGKLTLIYHEIMSLEPKDHFNYLVGKICHTMNYDNYPYIADTATAIRKLHKDHGLRKVAMFVH